MPSELSDPLADELAEAILLARKEHLQRRIREQSKRDYMYMSDVHHCDRRNFYSMAEGDKRKPMDEFGSARTESGEKWEEIINAQLSGMGFSLLKRGVSVAIYNQAGEKIASGKLDGIVEYKKAQVPIEIKNIDSMVYRQINSVEDLFKSQWTEKYIRQLLLYLFGNNLPSGLFIITDRGGLWKILVVHLGNWLDYCEKTVRQIERAHAAKKAGAVPDRITYDNRYCGSCDFKAVCNPTVTIEQGEAIEDDELLAVLARRQAVKESAAEFKELDEEVKEKFKGKARQFTVGARFQVIVTKGTRKKKNWELLDEAVLKSITTDEERWTVEIEDVQALDKKTKVC